MARIVLRSATLEDARILAYIQTQAWNAGFCGILSPETLAKATQPEQVEAMYRFVLQNHLAHVFLQYVDGTPQGICAWSANRENLGSDTAELICIHSLPKFWGCGYGSHMIQHMLQKARDAGYVRLVLWVFADNHRARAFYETHGFVLTTREKQNLGAKEVMYAITL